MTHYILSQSFKLGKLKNNFEGSDSLYIPEVFAELSSKRVLVLERIDGVHIDDYAGIERMGFDRTEIALKGAGAFFKMVLQDGLFHADPHPGNIFVLPDGRLGLVDFGIMGRVTEENMEHFASVLIALTSRDYDGLARQYVNLGFVSEESVDNDRFKQDLKEDLAELLEPYYGIKIRQIDFGSYVERVTHILHRHKLKIPQNLYLMDKALLTLEGILKQLDPGFDYFAAARPYVEELVKRKRHPRELLRTAQKNLLALSDLANTLPRQVRTVVGKVLRGDIQVKLKHEGFQHAIRDLDKSSNRLAFSVITAAIIVDRLARQRPVHENGLAVHARHAAPVVRQRHDVHLFRCRGLPQVTSHAAENCCQWGSLRCSSHSQARAISAS